MTIRLSMALPLCVDKDKTDVGVYDALGYSLAFTDTREEAKQAKRAFELVLAPRFTRDEAIAIVLNALAQFPTYANVERRYHPGIRLALEALDAARAFVDETDPIERKRVASATMADLLDAAGIR